MKCHIELKNGNTYPATARPWGTHFWTPQTSEMKDSWFSHKTETATPYFYSVYLADHDCTVELSPSARAPIHIKAAGNSDRAVYVNELKVNNKQYDKNYITHDRLINGCKLKFKMSDMADTTRGTAPDSAPFSSSRETDN